MKTTIPEPHPEPDERTASVPIINHGYVPHAWNADKNVCRRCGATWPTTEGCP